MDYSTGKRLVHLIKGEANFDVEKDPQRPFVVSTSEIEFKALGTEFVVRYGEKQLDLIVSEGQVLLSPKSEANEEVKYRNETIVGSSQKAVINFENETNPVNLQNLTQQEISSELFWKPELFEFKDESLENIVNAFNDKNIIQIQFADESIKELRLSSLFWSDNVEAFVRLLVSNFGIRVQYADDTQIVLNKQNT